MRERRANPRVHAHIFGIAVRGCRGYGSGTPLPSVSAQASITYGTRGISAVEKTYAYWADGLLGPQSALQAPVMAQHVSPSRHSTSPSGGRQSPTRKSKEFESAPVT